MKHTGKTASELLGDFPLTKTGGRWGGLLMGFLLGGLFAGGWVHQHPLQAECFGPYLQCWWKTTTAGFSLTHPASSGLSRPALRYALFRYGNEDHQYDAALLAYRLYPASVKNPVAYVRTQEAWPAVYDAPPLLVWQWPLGVLLVTGFLGFGLGQRRDEEYQKKLRVGVHVEGARLLSTKEYNRANRGDGIRYAVYPRTTERKVFYL